MITSSTYAYQWESNLLNLSKSNQYTFCDLEGVEVIIDDILVHSTTLKVHNEKLKKVLELCRERNLKLNGAKTKLLQDETSYIAHCITKDGVKIAEDKVKGIKEMLEKQKFKRCSYDYLYVQVLPESVIHYKTTPRSD